MYMHYNLILTSLLHHPVYQACSVICIPAEKCASGIDLKGSLVVVSADQEFLIFNCQERSGANLFPEWRTQQFGNQVCSYNPCHQHSALMCEQIIGLKAYFQPTLPLLLCEIRTPLKNSIHGVNFHPELAPFVGSDLANKNLKTQVG